MSFVQLRAAETSARERRPDFRDCMVGLDYRSALRPNATGVGRYVRDLVSGLSSVDDHERYTLFLDEGRRAVVPLAPQFRHTSSLRTFRRNGLRQLWEEVWLPRAIARQGVGVYHGPLGFLPYALSNRIGTVVTIHDVAHRAVPESVSRFFRTRLDAGLRHSTGSADVIIADSHNTARDLATFYSVPSDAVTVIYPGIQSSFRPITDSNRRAVVGARFGVHRPFILYVGGLGTRKNVMTLLEAFAILREGLAGDLDLVLVGATSEAECLFHFVTTHGLQEVVHFPGYIADKDLPLLYSASAVFAYPSLYEGFGYPVVEAMACGAPVVCSNSSSLPEVAGTAGLLVAPTDIGAWVETLRSVILADNLGKSLQSASRRRAALFTLEQEANATLNVYMRAWERAKTRRKCDHRSTNHLGGLA